VIRPLGNGIVGWIAKTLVTSLTFGLALIPGANSLQKWLSHQIGGTLQQVQKPLTRWIVGMAQYVTFTSQAWAATGYDLYRFGAWVVDHHIPQEIAKAIRHPATTAKAAAAKVTTIEHVVYRFPKTWRAEIRKAVAVALPGVLVPELPLLKWLRRHLGELQKVAKIAAAIGVALPGIIGRARPYPWLTKWRHKTDADLRKLNRILGRTGFLALITTTLGIEIARLMRCPNTRGIAKSFCGANLNGLLGLLGGLAILEGRFSIVEMAEGMLDLEEDMVGLIGGAFTELDGLV